ncbi:MAG: BrxA/BrxB family bacilliredoxin [Calditrichia bacterium]
MKNIDLRYMPTYDPASVQYMRDELKSVGFSELLSLEDVDKALLNNSGETALLVVNSVCGCAAGGARPGVAHALQHSTIPEHLVTVFAGMEKRAVEYVRQRFLSDYVPSSPVIALIKNGEVVFIMERKDLVEKEPEQIGEILREQFDKFCKRQGPSISPEEYDQLSFTIQCSSNLPRYENG